MTYSTEWQEATQTTTAEMPLFLLEIDHTDFEEPARIVNATEAITSNGMEYQPIAFHARLPDVGTGSSPRAEFKIDNVGRLLTDPIAASSGGRNATVTLRVIRRSAPDTVEFETILSVIKTSVTATEVTIETGYSDLINRPAVQLRYDPKHAHGLF